MLFLLSLVSIVIACLLFTYYRLKANEDKFNRPSFFNSPSRREFLVVLIILLFVSGAYALARQNLYEYILLIPFLYLLGYYFARMEWEQNIVISRILKDSIIFADPDLNLSKEKQLIAPIEFSMMRTSFDKTYILKARRYLEERIEGGMVKSAKDLPQEMWTIWKSAAKSEIKEDPDLKLSQTRIDYLYEEIVEKKTHDDIKKQLTKSFWSAEAFVERKIKNFAFVSVPRPDFTRDEINLVESDVNNAETGKEESAKVIAVFGNISMQAAKKFGWVEDGDEYLALAALEFSRRYPEHSFSKKIKKQHKFSNQQILNYAQSWESLDTSQTKVV